MNELKQRIIEETGLSEKELEEKIQEKVNKFSGMLNTEAAVYLIGKEHQIGLEHKTNSINELKKGDEANIKGEIVSVYSEREFESKGKTGKVRNVLIKDKTGTAFIVLWNGDTEKIKENDIGKEIELKEFTVEEYNGKIQLKKGFNGIIELKETKEIGITKISEIVNGETNVSVKGRILREFPLKEFESNGKNGMLKRIELIDETGIINVVLWNENAKQEINENQCIKINGLNSRKGFNGIELHSGQNLEIKESTGIKELKELCIELIGKKELNKVIEGNRFVAEGKIKQLNKTRLLFNVCSECKGKIEEEDNRFFCKRCGQILKPDKKLVVSFELEDDSAEMKTMVYGKTAEKIIELSTEKTEERTNEIILDEVINELNEKIKGKEISFLALAKNNSFNEETELVLEKLF